MGVIKLGKDPDITTPQTNLKGLGRRRNQFNYLANDLTLELRATSPYTRVSESDMLFIEPFFGNSQRSRLSFNLASWRIPEYRYGEPEWPRQSAHKWQRGSGQTYDSDLRHTMTSFEHE